MASFWSTQFPIIKLSGIANPDNMLCYFTSNNTEIVSFNSEPEKIVKPISDTASVRVNLSNNVNSASTDVTLSVYAKYNNGQQSNPVSNSFTIKNALTEFPSVSVSKTDNGTHESVSFTIANPTTPVYGWLPSSTVLYNIDTTLKNVTTVSQTNNIFNVVSNIDLGDSIKTGNFKLYVNANTLGNLTELSYETTLSFYQKTNSLEISASTLNLTPNQNYTLTYSASPSYRYNKGVIVTTSNSGVVTVEKQPNEDAYILTAKAPGSATITAVAADNNSVRKTCSVTVNYAGQTALTINPNSYTLNPGESFDVTLSYIGLTNLIHSANNNLVSLSDINNNAFTITASKDITNESTSSITISGNEQTGFNGGNKQSTCNVTIKPLVLLIEDDYDYDHDIDHDYEY